MAMVRADCDVGNNAINVADNYSSDLTVSVAPRMSGYGDGLGTIRPISRVGSHKRGSVELRFIRPADRPGTTPRRSARSNRIHLIDAPDRSKVDLGFRERLRALDHHARDRKAHRKLRPRLRSVLHLRKSASICGLIRSCAERASSLVREDESADYTDLRRLRSAVDQLGDHVLRRIHDILIRGVASDQRLSHAEIVRITRFR
jgi:hypothetical protein